MNNTQRIHADLMLQSSFNDFDAPKVLADLEAHENFWRGFIFNSMNDLITLRDLPGDFNNADTLWILSVKGKENELWDLAQTWKADELDWMPESETSALLGTGENRNNPKALLRVWWD